MARKSNRKAQLMRRQRTLLCAPWIMSSNAHDYGSFGAALFDIVNVHFGRGAGPGALTRSLPHRETAPHPFLDIAGLAHRTERSPRKREAGG